MHDARPRRVARRRDGRVVAQQPADQRVAGLAGAPGAGVDGKAGGLVDHGDVIVLVDDL